jgi:hypothetical protein
VIRLKLKELFKIDDEINVTYKETVRKKAIQRAGKVISVNEKFLTVNFGKYKESLDIFKINQGFIKVVKSDYLLLKES